MSSKVNCVKRVPLVFAAAMLISCVWTVSTAFAGEQLRSETVKFQDLNLNTPEGVQALYGRIHAAALRVCSSSDPIQHYADSSCAKKSEANAIEKANRPQLTAFYRMKTGVSTPPLSASR